MLRYIARRLLYSILVLLVISLLTFLIFVKLPAGDPARRAVGKTTTKEQIAAAREAFGLDEPLVVQYAVRERACPVPEHLPVRRCVLLVRELRSGPG